MRLLSIFAVILVSLEAFAQPSAEAMAAEVSDNVATEYAECAAYFSVVQGAFLNSGKTTEAQQYKGVSDKAAEFSLFAARQSRTEEMATRVTLARFEMNLKAMQTTIGNNYSNISLVMNKYSDSCVEAMTDSTALIKRWKDRVTSRYSKDSGAPR